MRFVIAKAESRLGRSRKNDFVVDDTSISRNHALIAVGENHIVVTDLESRNGTYLDDLRVAGRVTVKHGQVIRFGSVPFVAELEDADAIQASSEELTADLKEEKLACEELLSEGQRRVFELLRAGLQEKAIARRLSLSSHTVHSHIKKIYRCFGVHSRAELLASLMETGKGQTQQFS
jgi:DNA-binding NarL/FixJ family response regulator